MKILSAEFVTSVAVGGQVPAEGLPVVALIGRSNVGKSTLVNTLVRRRIARAGGAPGTTRLLNLYRVRLSARPRGSTGVMLVDLPGYGYARGGDQAQRTFDELVRDFFDEAVVSGSAAPAQRDRFRLAEVVLVVDVRHPGLASDLAAHAWVAEREHPLVTVATKIDRLNRAERDRALAGHRAVLGPVIGVSSRTGEGIPAVWMALMDRLLEPAAIMGSSAPSGSGDKESFR